MAVQDFFMVGIIMIVLAASLLIGITVWNYMYAELKDSDVYTDTTAKGILDEGDSTLGLFDYAIVGVQVILILGLVGSVFLIDSHPALFPVFVFLIIISLFINNIFADVWGAFTEVNETNTTITNQLPLTDKIYDNIGVITAVVLFIFVIILFAKGRGGGIGR